MIFADLIFLYLFLPANLLLYYLSGSRGWRNGILVVFSLLFYAWGEPVYLLLLLFSVGLNYLYGRVIELLCGTPQAGLALAVILFIDLGLLGVFKYSGLAVETVNSLLGLSLPVPGLSLPIGISFYTFQSLSYVIDVYRREVKSEKNILRVALYIVLFPQLVAGPIVRYATIADEIVNRKESIDDFYHGMIRFLFGLAKKVLIANQVAQVADEAFNQGADHLATGLAWLGVVAYTAQIYFDFSGYSDMAIGLGRMFGFHFLENFNYPYIAKSITEFWRRWHISLSTWFRDYVYIPLGGNRCSRKRQIFNLLVVWGLTGLWHGAEWNFICWGLYYALLLIGERYVWGGLMDKLPSVIGHIYTMLFVMVGWLIFRASSLGQILSFLSAMFGANHCGIWNDQATYLVLEYRWDLLLAVIASLPVKTKLQDILDSHRDGRLSVALSTIGIPIFALGVGALSVVFLVSSGFNPFIYFQF